jgi:hypothetical protein
VTIEQFGCSAVIQNRGLPISRNAELAMCDKCVELDKKIERYRRIAGAIADRFKTDRLKASIAELKARKMELHPEQE